MHFEMLTSIFLGKKIWTLVIWKSKLKKTVYFSKKEFSIMDIKAGLYTCTIHNVEHLGQETAVKYII
jgi:hypothetical protein